MDVVFIHGAGLNVQQTSVMACQVTPDATGQRAGGVIEGKAWGMLTLALLALSDWLAEVWTG